MRTSALPALFAAAASVVLPSNVLASLDTVDNSDYGIQMGITPPPPSNCRSFTDSAGSGAHCYFSRFTTPAGLMYGYLVGYDSPVSNIEVRFSNLTVVISGLVICGGSHRGCDGTPTWDLDSTRYDYASLFSSTVDRQTAVFALNGMVPASPVRGNQVAFLVISGTAPDDVADITVRPLRPSPTFDVLHAFTGGADGAIPVAGLIQARDGYFYGTTPNGGSSNSGVIFQMAVDGTVNIVHTFTGGADGATPYAALIQATDGNFYGTTLYGGGTGCGGTGCGTIFRVTPDGIETVLYAFADRSAHPYSLIEGVDGNLYGTSKTGGGSGCGGLGCGSAFRLTSDGTVTVLHEFADSAEANPASALIQANDGNFYGTTAPIFPSNSTTGTIFQMKPDGTVTVVFAFDASTGPVAPILQGSDGKLYGAAYLGNGSDKGRIFSLDLDGTNFAVLYRFTGGLDGGHPTGLIQATDGNFYGTADSGGGSGSCLEGCGTVFQLRPDGTFSVLHAFDDNNGSHPLAVIQADDGSVEPHIALYGTTQNGGASTYGVVFRLIMSP